MISTMKILCNRTNFAKNLSICPITLFSGYYVISRNALSRRNYFEIGFSSSKVATFFQFATAQEKVSRGKIEHIKIRF